MLGRVTDCFVCFVTDRRGARAVGVDTRTAVLLPSLGGRDPTGASGTPTPDKLILWKSAFASR